MSILNGPNSIGRISQRVKSVSFFRWIGPCLRGSVLDWAGYPEICRAANVTYTEWGGRETSIANGGSLRGLVGLRRLSRRHEEKETSEQVTTPVTWMRCDVRAKSSASLWQLKYLSAFWFLCVCLVFKRNVRLCVQTTVHEIKQISKCVDVAKLSGKPYATEKYKFGSQLYIMLFNFTIFKYYFYRFMIGIFKAKE